MSQAANTSNDEDTGFSFITAGIQATREATALSAVFATAFFSAPKFLMGRGNEVPNDLQNAGDMARTIFNESVQAGAAASSWARNSGTPLKYAGMIAEAGASQAMEAIGAGKLNHARMFADLLGLFNEGPTALVLGDVKAQVKRGAVDVKRRLGLSLSAGDAQDMLAAIDGINASRLYPRAYEFIYDHIRSLASEPALGTLKGHSIYAPTEELIALSSSFDKAQIPHTVAVLEDAAKNPGAGDMNARLNAALKQDGPGAYERFSAKAWDLIRVVALKDTTPFLKNAVASIPQCESYLRDTAGGTANYFDTLVQAPTFLRALIYISEANDKGHFLNGAHVAFPPATSKHAGDILDGYLKQVLGDQAKDHPFFSANRARQEKEHELDVQAALDRTRRAMTP